MTSCSWLPPWRQILNLSNRSARHFILILGRPANMTSSDSRIRNGAISCAPATTGNSFRASTKDGTVSCGAFAEARQAQTSAKDVTGKRPARIHPHRLSTMRIWAGFHFRVRSSAVERCRAQSVAVSSNLTRCSNLFKARGAARDLDAGASPRALHRR